VFTTTLAAKLGSELFLGSLFLLFALANLHVANRGSLSATHIFPEGGNVYRLKPDDAARVIKPLSMAVSAVLALLAGNWGALQWQNALLFINGITAGIDDPVIGKDLGFYLFSLPLLEQLNGFAGFLLPVTALLVAALYYLQSGIVLTERGALPPVIVVVVYGIGILAYPALLQKFKVAPN